MGKQLLIDFNQVKEDIKQDIERQLMEECKVKIDLLIAALLGFIVGSFATIIVLSLCAAGKGDDPD